MSHTTDLSALHPRSRFPAGCDLVVEVLDKRAAELVRVPVRADTTAAGLLGRAAQLHREACDRSTGLARYFPKSKGFRTRFVRPEIGTD